jgi:predicted MFS family arabinose efflux permease
VTTVPADRNSHTVDSRRGWLMVAAAAVSMFTVFGIAYSFGAFFESMAAEFGTGAGATALVFSVTISLSFALAPITGRYADKLGPRPVLWVGAASLAAGLLLTTVVPSIVIGYVTYGVGVGVAVACGYVPMVSTVGGWFVRQRAAALGVAVAGIGLGTLVGSPLAAALISATGWRTTFVIYALGGAGLMLAASVVAERGPAAGQAARLRPIGELLRIRAFAILYSASLLVTFGLFVPFVFIASYAEARGVGEVAAATLVGLIGGASIVGRLGLGTLAVRFGATRLFRFSFLVMGLSHLIWLVAGDTYPLLVAYTVVLGFGYGGFIAISPAVVADRFGLEGMGGVLGTLYTSAAVGSLLGPPLAGLLFDHLGAGAAIGAAAAVSLAGWSVLLALDQG